MPSRTATARASAPSPLPEIERKVSGRVARPDAAQGNTAFVYLIPIFPVGLAWGRARIEWEVDLRELPVKPLSDDSRATFLTTNRFPAMLPSAVPPM